MGKPIIMGRKTFTSIGKPLPGRSNIVISRSPLFLAEGVTVVSSLAAAMELAQRLALEDGADEAVVIGGAEIYQAALPFADRLYFTEVHTSLEGDAVLPAIDWTRWREVSRERHAAQAPNQYDYSFVCYERVDDN